MTNLDRDPSKFFIYLLFVYTTTLCVTAMYRMLAALSSTIDDAVRFAGTALNLLLIYVGYVIPKRKDYFPLLYSSSEIVDGTKLGFSTITTSENLVRLGRLIDCHFKMSC